MMENPSLSGEHLEYILDLIQSANEMDIPPDWDAVLRLGGSYLGAQHDSWIHGKRYFNEKSGEL